MIIVIDAALTFGLLESDNPADGDADGLGEAPERESDEKGSAEEGDFLCAEDEDVPLGAVIRSKLEPDL